MVNVVKAAAALVEARRSGVRLKRFDDDCKPATMGEAYAIQDEVMRQSGDRIGGWKVGALSYKHPTSASPLPASRIVPSPLNRSSSAASLLGVEAEIAFKFSRSFGPRAEPYAHDEVLEGVQSVHPVIETLESRFENILTIDRLSAVADNISHGDLIIGPAINGWQSLNLERPNVKITNKGRLFALGIGNNGGDPYRLLVELVNHAANERGGLSAGAMVTTGTCTGILFCEPGSVIVADFKNMGKVEVNFPVEAVGGSALSLA